MLLLVLLLHAVVVILLTLYYYYYRASNNDFWPDCTYQMYLNLSTIRGCDDYRLLRYEGSLNDHLKIL